MVLVTPRNRDAVLQRDGHCDRGSTIVQTFDFGHHTDGSAYIVMELLGRETLDERTKTRGTFEIANAVLIVRRVATSFGAAHAQGIVHRDQPGIGMVGRR